MSKLSGKPLETVFEVVIPCESRNQAEFYVLAFKTHIGIPNAEVREVAK